MTPKQAFDDVMARARRLLALHDGLVNLRSRKIRKDWKASFCDLMHWPKAAELERVDSRQAIIVLRDGATLVTKDFSRAALDDLLRSALALGVSALDRYVHERVIKGVVRALRRRKVSPKQTELSMPAIASLKMARAAVVARRKGKPFRPANEVRKALQEALHKRPFQSWKEVQYAFDLIGISSLQGDLQAAYHLADLKPIRTKLNEIANRRNRIVHEGDLVRHERGGNVRHHPIAPKMVHDALDFLDTFVGHLDTL